MTHSASPPGYRAPTATAVSIPAQLKLLKDYAAAQGFKVAQEYIDVETAKQTGRTSFGEMVAYLKAHPSIRVMLVEKTDRLYRNLKDWVTMDDLDVEMHFPKGCRGRPEYLPDCAPRGLGFREHPVPEYGRQRRRATLLLCCGPSNPEDARRMRRCRRQGILGDGGAPEASPHAQ
jgi:hypothetical protein